MDSSKIIIGIGFVLCLSLVVESKTSSTIVTRSNKTVLVGKNVRAKKGLAYSYPTSILTSNQLRRYIDSYLDRKKEYYWDWHPILAFGVENFLSYAAHFCKYETENGTLEVVSVGSGRGNIENEIIEVYANLFGGELRITLVEANPAFKIDFITQTLKDKIKKLQTSGDRDVKDESTGPVDFPTVDDLIAERANAVGNCVLFIIWPWGDYDIEAIRKLKPRAVLTMYEMQGVSGSSEFCACLNPRGNTSHARGRECRPRLSNYVIEEIAYQEVNYPRTEEWFNTTYMSQVKYKFRLVRLKRKN